MQTQTYFLDLISEAVAKAKRVLIVGHKGPDFDSAGSCFGLSMALEQMGKQTMTYVGDMPAKLRHAFGVAGANIEPEGIVSFNPDLVMLLDYGAVRMLNKHMTEFIEEKKPFVVSIDHHTLEDQFGDVVWVDDTKSSASEMIFDLLEHMGQAINPRVGYCLLVGILSDTGVFVYDVHSERLLPKVQKLNVSGREFSLAFKVVRSWDSLEQFLLLGKISSRLKIDEDLGFAYVIIRKNGELSGLRSFLANQMLFIDSLKCILVLQRMADGGYRGSLRSSALESSINVARIASQFVGGGHVNSAAFTSRMSSVKIIETVKKHIREQQKESL